MDEPMKIICCGDHGNDNGNVPAWAAMMGNGGWNNNGMWNNPFAYLMFMMFANRMGWNNGWGNGDGWGNGQGQQNIEVQNQLQAIRSQLQDNQNNDCVLRAITGTSADVRQLAQNLNCDFNTLNACCCDLKQAIATVGGNVGFSAERVINAVNMGDCNVIRALENCCCGLQRQISDFRADMQLQMCQQTGVLREGQRDLGSAVTQGFSQAGFQAQRDTCDIIRAGQDNTQRIIDTLNTHWKDEQAREIQDLKAQLSQKEQTDAIFERLYRARHYGNDCGCGCNNGCGF